MIGRKPTSKAPGGWLSVASSLSCTVAFLVILLAESTLPVLRKPVVPLLCDRDVVFITLGKRGGWDERVVCPAEGSGMVYGVFRGERRDVNLPYYALMALFYGAASFILFAVPLYISSRRRQGAGY
jgi:hypothetical protein